MLRPDLAGEIGNLTYIRQSRTFEEYRRPLPLARCRRPDNQHAALARYNRPLIGRNSQSLRPTSDTVAAGSYRTLSLSTAPALLRRRGLGRTGAVTFLARVLP